MRRNCLADADGDGICDGDEIAGYQDDAACNYDATATDDDGSCTYADAGLDCDGNLADADGDGIATVMRSPAARTTPPATTTPPPPTTRVLHLRRRRPRLRRQLPRRRRWRRNRDGDEIAGCQDDTACNYATATDDDGSCTYADAGLDCDGNCLADADGDGICDGDEIAGCTDEAANNDPAATDDDGSATTPVVPTGANPTPTRVATVLALITVDGGNMMDAVGAFVGDEPAVKATSSNSRARPTST